MGCLALLEDIGRFNPPLTIALLQYIDPDRFSRLLVGELMCQSDFGGEEPDLLDLGRPRL